MEIVYGWKGLLKNNPNMYVHKTLHDCRRRKRMKASVQINDGVSAPAPGPAEAIQIDNNSFYINAGLHNDYRQRLYANIDYKDKYQQLMHVLLLPL
ncbi:hypothetical protein EVAR_27198_1 [Eumeta japonica]|uniref:Uncharacterized protein n=1 Tax=Eumeta variegata TaxID=151549 RepID=A0A4C1VYF5_EUMVA|nr:hypothetical protein EVAR_27198_1 [Eumeta japonica]